MITSKKELDFYISVDLMIDKGYFKLRLIDHVKNIILPNIVTFLYALRKTEYYSYKKKIPNGGFNTLFLSFGIYIPKFGCKI